MFQVFRSPLLRALKRGQKRGQVYVLRLTSYFSSHTVALGGLRYSSVSGIVYEVERSLSKEKQMSKRLEEIKNHILNRQSRFDPLFMVSSLI